jgi:hypothetical protein
MEDIYAIFDLLKESSWIESLDSYGYKYSKDLIPTLVTELDESTWAEQLEHLKPDITNAGMKYLSIPEMKAIVQAQM